MSQPALRRSSRLLALPVVMKAETISTKTSKRKRIIKADLGSDEEREMHPSTTKKRKKMANKEIELEVASQGSKVKLEPVYVIPDVQKKETTFRGRLGVDFLSFWCNWLG